MVLELFEPLKFDCYKLKMDVPVSFALHFKILWYTGTDTNTYLGLGGSVGCASDGRPGGRGFDPRRGRQHSSVEIDHEIFSTVILSLQLIQEGQLSVSGERMCTILVNRLED